ncbi:MAG: hypothetical protein V1685_03270 [Parcubacteria group bacterium]
MKRSPPNHSPPRARLPSLEDLTIMVSLKRRYHRRIGILLLDMHVRRKIPLERLGQLWSVEPDRIRLWISWYRIAEEPSLVQPSPDHVTLSSSATGMVVSAIINLWIAHHDWTAVAAGLNATPDALSAWVDEHRSAISPGMIPQDALKRLIARDYSTQDAGISYEHPLLTPNRRPSGVKLTLEAEQAVARACEEAGLPENELLVNLYDEDRLHSIATKLGLTVPAYLALVRHYNGGALPASESSAQEDDW